jgi:hypothetical protein
MRICRILFSLMLLACIAAQAKAPIINSTSPAPLDLSPENMKIVSTEHTAEYLAKTGGLAEPSSLAAGSVSGNWSFDLRDAGDRPVASMDLRLFQAGNVVFGSGSLKAFVQNIQAITAYGSLMEVNTLILGVVSLEDVNLYRLTINNVDTNAISGTFNAYSSNGGEPLIGTISGGRNVPRSLS